MNCKDFDALLHSAPLDSLETAQREEALNHLGTCAECRFKHRVQEDMSRLDEDGEVPASFSTAWRERIIQEEVPPMKQFPQLKKWLAIAAAFVVLVGGTWLAGQGRRQAGLQTSASRDYGSYTSPYDTSSRAALDSSAPTGSAPMAELSMEASTAKNSSQPNEKIIHTARLELSTREFDKDHALILSTLAANGGRVQDTNLYNSSGSLRSLYLTLRVPSANMDRFVAALQGVGKLVSYSQSAEDVSEQYFDTETRQKTLMAKLERLQALMAKAGSVEDLISIENSISDTQYELDRLTGQLRGIDSRVDDATLTLSLNELSPIETSQNQEEGLGERIVNGLKAALNALGVMLGDMVVFLSIALPFLVIAAVITLVIYALIKRRKNK